MFSSALKSFSSNITSNYTIAPQPSSTAGPWKIFDAKRKGSGKAASVFVFDKKTLEASAGGLGGRGSSTSVKAAQVEVLERLKKEASSLARLRHPSILELAEPVEETRNGGLMFATEPITASLSALLAEKDDQERSGGVGGRGSRYVVEEADGSKRRRELEIDELEIQKGLLQIGKGLEFMHESAGLVHSNLTPDAIVINGKGDWKITGLAFAGPAADSDKPTSITPIALHEVLNHDPRLPAIVQLSLDYTSPDFVLDNNLTSSADMFSLGLLIVALYNSPHKSPIECHGSLSSYKRIFSASSTVPSKQNNFLCSGKVPPNLISDLLPGLITRRPAQRLTARSFQQAQYFDNILVSTLRFLEAFPAKSASEKAQFMKGLPRIMPQFPASVLEKKLLPALLDETKDRDLLAPVMLNVFAIIKALPSGKRAFIETVIPKLREVFLSVAAVKGNNPNPKDTSKEAGLMIVLENMDAVAENTSGKEFRDDILPILAVGLASPTHAVIDASLSTLSHVTPKLDYTTIKNELFPVIAGVFAHTSSLGIKIQGLEAFYVLCGGKPDEDAPFGDGLDGNITRVEESKNSNTAVLDRFTVQEKVVPLIKGIKTKEPAVMMAALKVLKQVGLVVDTDYLAMEILPLLWSFSLGPLLDLPQFQAFMSLIKSLSSRIEREHTQKLRELTASNATSSTQSVRASGRSATSAMAASTNGEEVDFESLVSGKATSNGDNDMLNDWDAPVAPAARPATSRTASMQQKQPAPSFSWATPSSTPSQPVQSSMNNALRAQASTTRTVTPDQSMGGFAALTPNSQFNHPLQPQRPAVGTASSSGSMTLPSRLSAPNSGGASINWSAAAAPSTNTWASTTRSSSYGPTAASNSFSIAPPPKSPPIQNTSTMPASINGTLKPQRQVFPAASNGTAGSSANVKQGLDKYESLI